MTEPGCICLEWPRDDCPVFGHGRRTHPVARPRITKPPVDYREFLMLVATALRDLSVTAALFEQAVQIDQSGVEERQIRMDRTIDYVDEVLALVVEEEGDIRPRYLEGYSTSKTVGDDL